MFFWNSLAFSMIQRMLAIWSLVPLPFLKPAWTSGSSRFRYCWSLAWRILSITLLACAAAAAKSLQSCPTLCDPIGGSPPGSPIPGILQARTLEWVAISFSNAWKWKVKGKLLSPVQWVLLCSSLSILWHCLSLRLEWKLTFSSPVATAEFSKFPNFKCNGVYMPVPIPQCIPFPFFSPLVTKSLFFTSVNLFLFCK